MLVALAALAQQPGETLPGFRSPATYDSSQIDNIDLYGGDIGVTIPLGPVYPLGPNFSWGLAAHATDKIWNYIDDGCGTGGQRALIHGLPTIGAGWTLELGHIEGAIVGGGSYVSPDGGKHVGTPSSDGSRLRIKCQTTTSCTVETPDGIIYTFAHAYTIPRPTAGSSVDFNYLVPEVSPPQQVGLTSITNHFGKTLLSVTYNASPNDWEIASISLEPLTAQARPITFTYGPVTISGVTWQVLTQLSFPSAAGAAHNLVMGFAYNTMPITRNTFDNLPNGFGSCLASGATANVPTLGAITFNDGTAVLQTYAFTYQHTSDNADSLLSQITLPAGGTIAYTYDTQVMTNHFGNGNPPTDLESSAADPPSFSPSIPVGAPPIAGCGDKRAAYLDGSPAVIKRVAKASTTDTGIITQYARDEYDPDDPCMSDGYANVTRRTLVSEPDGDGTFHYVKYLFHVPDVVSEDPTTAGFELERRYYADTNFGGTPIRTIVNCYAGNVPNSTPVCGYLANSTTVQTYSIAGQVRRQASVTWFGANAPGGGTCSGTAPPCTAIAADTTTYSANALKYGKWTTTSTLTPMSGWTSRANVKTLTPQVDGTDGTNGHWFLDLWSNDSVTDAGAPAPSSVATTANFSPSTAFLNNQGVSDSYGGVTTYFTSTNGDPTTIETKGSAPITGDFVDTCTYQSGLPTSCTRTGMSWKSLDVTRENNTGAVTISRDPNVLATTYTYDAIGRVTKALPPPGDDSTIRATRTCYLLASDNSASNPSNLNFVWTKAGSSDANTCLSNDSGALTWTATQLDGLERPIREYRLLPNDLGSLSQWAIRDTVYDSAGHVASVSEWTPCVPNGSGLINIGYCAVGLSSNNPSHKTTYSNFDTFGRPQTITRADGTTTTITRSDDIGHNTLPPDDPTCAAAVYTCIRFSDSLEGDTVTVGGVNATTVTRTDALGRVIAVQEPAVTGVADVTTYKYNALDKTAAVTQGVQARSYTLDARGWLRSESNPESGTTSYASYNALGAVGQRTAGTGTDQAVTTYTHNDAAGRLTEIDAAVNGGAQTVIAQYTYDSNPLSLTPDYPNGQLTQSIGWNYPLDPGPRTTQQLGFGGPGGRLSKRVTTIGSDSDPNDGAGVRDGESISTTEQWTYSNLGLIDTYNHPRTSGTYQEDPSYLNGLPSATSAGGSGVFSSVRYLPFGGLKTWTAQNGVVTTIGQATNLMPRPSSISTSGATTNFSSGTYSYDGAGNITAIGTDTFKYDGRSRLASVDYGFASPNCTDSLGNANRDQCFTYDRYGNLTNVAATNLRSLPTSPATNCPTGQTCSSRGNMSSDGAFDAVDRIKGGAGWLYLYDAQGERVAKFPDAPILRREMAKLVIQARGEAKSTTGCYPSNPAVDFYYDDVACSDPDRGWLDKANEDGIAQGFGNRTYQPESPVNRSQMAKFIVIARNEQPVNSGLCDPNHLTFSDVLCTNGFWGYIQQLYNDGLTNGCGDGTTYCPSDNVPESQMMAFTRRSWPTFLYVPRGTIYTLRGAAGQIATEMVSTPGSTSYPTNDFPVATTVTRDNVFLGNLLVASQSSNTLGGPLGWTYYHADHLGTPRLVTGAEGPLLLKYWPFGDEVSGNLPTSQRLKFATMERDAEANYYYDHARTVDFNLGRFVSKDLFGGTVQWPLTLNRYTYGIANPLKYVDVNGLDCSDTTSAEECGPVAQNSNSFTLGWVIVPPPPPPPEQESGDSDRGTWGLGQLLRGSLFFQTLTAFGENLISAQYWKSELSDGGCLAVFSHGAEDSDILAPLQAGNSAGVETFIKGQAATAAVGYAAAHGLSVPMRSSVVRGILQAGETTAAAFAPAYLDIQVAVGLIKEVTALGKGECH